MRTKDMKGILLLGLMFVTNSAYADEWTDLNAAINETRVSNLKCIERDDGALYRIRDSQPERCSIDVGWVANENVSRQLDSEESKKAKWRVTSCRCQHE